jgi:hypothetical protein
MSPPRETNSKPVLEGTLAATNTDSVPRIRYQSGVTV